MNHKLKYLQLVFWVFLFASSTTAQEFIWEIGNHSFFDNREYFNSYVDHQTIFGSRIYGYAGFSINSKHQFGAGLDYLYEFGSKGELLKPDIIMFYSSRSDNLEFTIGAFPRHHKISMPFALFSDTINYYRPNIEGMLLEYRTDYFRHNAWIDWTSRQSYSKREIFVLGFSGYFSRNVFLYHHHFIMSHVAHSKNNDPDEHIRDNGGYSAMTGLNFSHLTFLDTISVSSGVLGSYDRLRSVYDFSWPVGWISEAEAQYKGFGMHGLFYTGDEQIIISGDGFFKSDLYGRVDIFYHHQGGNLTGKLQFSFHFIPDVVDLSMSLVIRVRLGSSLPLLN